MPAKTSPVSPSTTHAAPTHPLGAGTQSAGAVPNPAPPIFPGFDDSFTHKFQLPSHGLPYVDDNGNPLLPDEGSVIVRMMTGEEEAILNSDAYNDQAKIAKIVASCTRVQTVSGKVLNTDILLSTDRLMLILFIRAHSLGSTYKLPGVCINRGCACEFEHEFDLIADLDVEEMPREHKRHKKGANGEPDSEWTETLTYDPRTGIVADELPMSKYGVKLRLLTGKDEDWIAREAAKGPKSVLKMRQPGDPSFYLRMVRMISAIRQPGGAWTTCIPDSQKDMTDVCDFIRRLPIRDTNYIGRLYTEHDVGINSVITAKCPACGSDTPITFRILSEFFRPTVGE